MALGPLPDVQNTLRVRYAGLHGVSPWVALFFWHYNGTPPTTAAMDGFCTAFGGLWGTHIRSAIPTSVSLQTCDAWDLSSREGNVGTATVNSAGTRPGTALPSSVAAVTSWKVNTRYRGGHPRTYWPAGVITDVAAGNRMWAESARNAFAAAAEGFLAGANAITIGGQSGYLQLVRYIHTPVPGGQPEYFLPPRQFAIADVSVDARIDTQRRRLGPDIS